MNEQTIDLPVATVPRDCIPWNGGKTGAGYGSVYLGGGRQMLAHRLVYQNVFGPIPDGHFVCHRCDNPACVNPAHLFLGTPKDNSMDAWKKGRLLAIPPQPGTANHKAKLSDSQVVEIRRRYAAGGILQKELAEEFGVKQITISNITTGKHWRHL